MWKSSCRGGCAAGCGLSGDLMRWTRLHAPRARERTATLNRRTYAMAAKPKVVVLGGGFGGLESTFYLRHKLGEQVALTLVSGRDSFLFKPNTIYIPFGEDPEKFEISLERPTRR